MKMARRLAGIAVVSVAALAMSLVMAAPAADAAPGEDVVAETSSHCGGFVLTQTNADTETATSAWLFNPSIFVPPICQQAVVAFCTDPATGVSTSILGNFTIQPGVQSTATCPPNFPSLTAALTLIQHA